MAAPYCVVSATALVDSTGTPVASATITFTPVTNSGAPVSFRLPGVGVAHGAPVVANVVDGAFSLKLADTSLTHPVNIGYAVTLIDNITGLPLPLKGYDCFQPTGTSLDFDTVDPAIPSQSTYGIVGESPAQVSAAIAAAIAGGGGSYTSPNLVDPTAALANHAINHADTGPIVVTPTGFNLQSIPVAGGGTVTSNRALHCGGGYGPAFQDSTGAFLVPAAGSDLLGFLNAGVGIPALTALNVPATAVAFRPYLNVSGGGASGDDGPQDYSNWMIVVSPNAMPSSFTPFGTITPAGDPLVRTSAMTAAISAATSGLASGLTAPQVLNLLGNGAGGYLPKVRNFIDPANAVTSAAIQHAATAPSLATPGGFTLQVVPVLPGGTVTSNRALHASSGYGPAFADATGAFLVPAAGSDLLGFINAAAGIPASTHLNVPANAATFHPYLNVSAGGSGDLGQQDYPGWMVVQGNTMPSAFLPPLGAAPSLPLSGIAYTLFGDSYWAQFSNRPQNLIAAANGATAGAQYAQSGRGLWQIFTEFISGGTLNTSALQAALLAQQFVVIALVTNDITFCNQGHLTLGSASDAPVVPLGVQSSTEVYPTATFFAYARGAIQQIQQLAPLLNILVVGAIHRDRPVGSPLASGFDDWTTVDPLVDQFNAAWQTICHDNGLLFVDTAGRSGINQWNVLNPDGTANMLRDGLHPSDARGFPRYTKPIADDMIKMYNPVS